MTRKQRRKPGSTRSQTPPVSARHIATGVPERTEQVPNAAAQDPHAAGSATAISASSIRGPATTPRASLSYPIGPDGADATGFIRRAAALINDPRTAIYVDTSFLMWLTKGGAESRQQFLDWASTLGQRMHIPVWTYHEYYRHHSRDTLRANLAGEAKNLLISKMSQPPERRASDKARPEMLPERAGRGWFASRTCG